MVLPNSCILKTFFTLILKRVTYVFIFPFFSNVLSALLFLLSCFLSSSSNLHCLLRVIGKFVSSSLLLLHHWFMYVFRLFYLFVFCHCSKVTTVSLSCFCLVFVVSVAADVVVDLASLFTTVAFAHKVGGILIFFFILLISLFFIIYFLKCILFLFLG